ncbi:MAG: hypothetical protein SP4CHLAM5_06700 [Chlamydiia bacterium]|nr:hypothetical protein [Chlamydiia bacterium]MCH9618537.1 hypothetical protein [Chlamydiia bacterium]MCH9624245.1 hypothetical protein [Chlamydiia bacterium]
MTGMKRLADWKEIIPGADRKIDSSGGHEYSGLINNITKEIGVLDVIDFGCGDGRLCSIFPKGNYLGLDSDEEVLKAAQTSFEGYAFKKPDGEVYSTDICIVSKVFSELNEETIHDVLRRMRCKWLLVVEPMVPKEKVSNIFLFQERDREAYVRLMRIHDLLLVKHMIKSISNKEPEDVSFLLFKKAARNPID